MDKYREVYITIAYFAILQKRKRLYEGFVIGLGYAFRCPYVLRPTNFNGYSCPIKMSLPIDSFVLIQNQYVDNSPEMVERSLKGIFPFDQRLYIVKKGDTLDSIAKQNAVSVDSLIMWNNLPSNNHIQIGQKIIVSKKDYDLLYDSLHTQFDNNVPNFEYSDTKGSQDMDYLKHIIGPALIVSGLKLVPKHGGVGGGGAAGKWTSVASKVFRTADRNIQKALGTNAKLPAKGLLHRFLGTRGIGAATGRLVPYLGWGMTAWDIGWELGKEYGPINNIIYPCYLKWKRQNDEKQHINELLEYLNEDTNK